MGWLDWWTAPAFSNRPAKHYPIGACRSGRRHRFAVMASRKDYRNCKWCGATKWVG